MGIFVAMMIWSAIEEIQRFESPMKLVGYGQELVDVHRIFGQFLGGVSPFFELPVVGNLSFVCGFAIYLSSRKNSRTSLSHTSGTVRAA